MTMHDPTRADLRTPDASVADLRALVEEAGRDPALLKRGDAHAAAVREVIYRLDRGVLRVAERVEGPQRWQINGWLQQAINLYFGLAPLEAYQAGEIEFHDKIPPKHGLAEAGVRVVPPGVVRYGAHVEKGAVVMPGYVNIGARVGTGTMVDTWATVGSCAQVGKNVHLSGGVGLGGVLEPPAASPVIIEDGAFIG
ncbi:MAG: 2,3,4,5-tetrahydropyridine-2,6-dicarboxylate N-succinyltransferase, partial [Myxococcales bacterium]